MHSCSVIILLPTNIIKLPIVISFYRTLSMYLCLSPPLPPKDEFSLYQKQWDSLDQREKFDKLDTKCYMISPEVKNPCFPSQISFVPVKIKSIFLYKKLNNRVRKNLLPEKIGRTKKFDFDQICRLRFSLLVEFN